tara:strand:+ start:544 stop:714 length:171 start_codon:yes stop_codon:yes gene_type:complete
MTIEVKQLVIKSTVAEDSNNFQLEPAKNSDLRSFKKELLAECKQIITESLKSGRER